MKQYELNSHTQNVLATILDRKTPVGTSNITRYTADVVSAELTYPFHSAMPGKTFTAPNTTEYRFGASNGQEKDNEIAKGIFTADFWEYDSRLGRRWNVDPKPNPSISNYATFANNPIWITDIAGDSGEYYDTQGNKIGVSHDKLANAVVVIPDKMRKRFDRMYNIAKKGKTTDNDNVNKILRQYGKVYLVDDYWQFYDEHSNDIHNGSVYEPVDGKGTLINENGAAIKDINGVMTIYGKAEGKSPGNCTGFPSGDSKIHTHPNEGRRVYNKSSKETGTFAKGHLTLDKNLNLSGDVTTTSIRPDGSGIFEIGVTKTEIRLYNSDDVKVTVTRGQMFKK